MPYDILKIDAWLAAGYRFDLSSAAADHPPPAEYIRLYYLTRSAHALSNITFGRIKVARFRDLNDPFELLAVRLMGRKLRSAVHEFKSTEDAQTGLICLSEDWGSPVMWSHYGEKHRGICLGFDVLRSEVRAVLYDDKRVRTALAADADPTNLPEELQEVLRRTKCHEWKYEKEQRMFIPLSTTTEVGGLRFRAFDHKFQLAEVIIGPSCAESLDAVRRIVHLHWPTARTYRARLAWKTFKVVPQESSVP
jgi:hypothetical protein